MYLKSIHIKNIKGIEDFKMEFPEGKEAGWHVLLGANGSGKTTVLRAIALALIGPTEILRLDPPSWDSWIKKDSSGESKIGFALKLDGMTPQGETEYQEQSGVIRFLKSDDGIQLDANLLGGSKKPWSNGLSQFSAGFGPYRRFAGRHYSVDRFSRINPKVMAHLTLFEEDSALTETTLWIQELLVKKTSTDPVARDQAEFTLEGIKRLINHPHASLLPHQYMLEEINAEGVFFKDRNHQLFHLSELSEGMRSVICLALELIRLLRFKADAPVIFPGWLEEDAMNYVTLNGIVIIDEVDAHLHPDWQAGIGNWFRKVFPRMQFIVTTHSPLVVRAAGDDSQIWYLPEVASQEKPFLIGEQDRNRLVYGDVLDAFGTTYFGKQADRSPESKALLDQLSRLETKAIYGELSEEGWDKIQELKEKLSL